MHYCQVTSVPATRATENVDIEDANTYLFNLYKINTTFPPNGQNTLKAQYCRFIMINIILSSTVTCSLAEVKLRIILRLTIPKLRQYYCRPPQMKTHLSDTCMISSSIVSYTESLFPAYLIYVSDKVSLTCFSFNPHKGTNRDFQASRQFIYSVGRAECYRVVLCIKSNLKNRPFTNSRVNR